MSSRRRAACSIIVAVSVVYGAAVGAWADPPVCAVIELDAIGGLWINGEPGDLGSAKLSECAERKTFVLAPDSSVSVGEFVRIANRVQGLQRPTRYFFPSSRREIEELFGFDYLAKCQTFAHRTIEPLPSRSAIGSVDAVRIVRGDGRVTALEVDAATSVGVLDEVARSSGAYPQPGGVRIVVKSESQESEVRISDDQFFVPPPPVIERPASGVSTAVGVSAYHACIYPESAKQ